MLVIGLTGKTGSGKSTVSLLLEKNGYFIIDGDKVAREIVQKDTPGLKKLCEVFGEDILNPDKTLNRKLLAKKAFADENSTKKLNETTHPFINEKIKEKIEFADKNGYEVCVLDAAALLESDCRNFCDIVAVVYCDEELRLKRIIERDKISVEDAKLRMNAQKDDEYYFKNADIIIINDEKNNIVEETKKLIDFAEGKKW